MNRVNWKEEFNSADAERMELYHMVQKEAAQDNYEAGIDHW